MFKIPERMINKYEFVTLAAKRAEQLQMGAPPRVDDAEGKVTVTAQKEVACGLIKLVDPDRAPEEAEVEEEE